eukprot:1160714-Pelagomonas_calceolata.AAC.25
MVRNWGEQLCIHSASVCMSHATGTYALKCTWHAKAHKYAHTHTQGVDGSFMIANLLAMRDSYSELKAFVLSSKDGGLFASQGVGAAGALHAFAQIPSFGANVEIGTIQRRLAHPLCKGACFIASKGPSVGSVSSAQYKHRQTRSCALHASKQDACAHAHTQHTHSHSFCPSLDNCP